MAIFREPAHSVLKIREHRKREKALVASRKG